MRSVIDGAKLCAKLPNANAQQEIHSDRITAGSWTCHFLQVKFLNLRPRKSEIFKPQNKGNTSLQYLEAARKQLQRAAAIQQREKVFDTMRRVQDGLTSSASSAAGGRRDPRSRTSPFSISSSAAAGNSNAYGHRRW